MTGAALAGLYAITSREVVASAAAFEAAVAAALRGGAALIQYRDKWNAPPDRLDRARAARRLCHAAGVRLIVNDDVELAIEVGADGVHLGRGDAPLQLARVRLGGNAVIGVTCGADLERALAAQALGASYVAFGRFFDSRTKPDAPPAPLELLPRARAALALPVCAIGGIGPAQARAVCALGADLVAAVDGVFGAADIEAAARAYVREIGAARSGAAQAIP